MHSRHYDIPLGLFINGEWRTTGRATQPVINPADETVLAHLPLATVADLDDALAAAAAGFAVWSRMSALERSGILEQAAALMHERADQIGTLMSFEHGKMLADGLQEAHSSADIVKWFAEEGRRAYGRIVPGPLPHSRQLVLKVPVGPVAALTPWNFPVRIPARTVAAALAAGCSVILKAAEETPGSTIAMVRCFEDAGLPPGVLNLVFGVPAQVSEHLIASNVIKAVAFTGSIPVGKHLASLAAHNGLKKLVMELGGHAPMIVCDDVDVKRIATLTAQAKFRQAGQACISPTRFYIQRGVYDVFLDTFVDVASKLKLGSAFEPGVQASPVANARRLAAADAFVQDALAHGARLALGGHRLERAGFFYAPTVLADVPESARIMNEEPFGPVVPMSAFDTIEEVLLRANRLDYGLAAYAFTGSDRRALQLSNGLEAGMIGINSMLVSGAEVPFGGVKESGIGSENGIEGLQAYLVTKFVQQAVL
ncbi:NAD-dependent succinate-semialdehyde dehydrogenase [Paraburkholderia hayleyella]|uniref:NAD-dependent succinate-semialdehyde dehydrogenase n=1 Tax=Paraburkholderia hayleyella TaxID=2152889 RepID=UPI001291A685|nr:NAD-dependent succinate-semialdehyde dehydrogenase [Paraburkholderia hayleyella]